MADEAKGYSEEELALIVARALDERDAKKAAEAEAKEALVTKFEEGLEQGKEEGKKEALEEAKAWAEKKAPGYMQHARPGSEDDGDPKKGPMEAFRYWAKKGDPGAAKALTPSGRNVEHLGEEFLKTLSPDQKTILSQGGTGTYLVPDGFVAEILPLRDNASFVRQMGVRIIQTNLPVVDIPAESTSVANFTRSAEANAYTTDIPAFAQNQVTVQKWTLRHTASEEFLEDDATNFDQWFSRSLARSMARTESYYVAIGNGTNQHEGIFEGGTTDALTFDSSGNITADEIFELMMVLKTEYQPDAAWLMDNDTWRYLATLRDSNNWAFGAADYLTISNDGSAQAGTLYGRPVFLQGDIPVRAASTTVIMVGDPYYYGLVERKGLTIARNPFLQQAEGLVDFFSHFRQSGKVLAEEAWAGGLMHS